jgi:hypothetical protein
MSLTKESLVSDIPARDRNVVNLFLQCSFCVCISIKNMEMLVYMLKITEVVTLSATCGETTFFVFYQVSCPPPPHHLLPHNGPLLA